MTKISKKQINKVIQQLKGIDIAFLDLFCGAGGVSEGIEQAVVDSKKVATVILCINHDFMAIQSHKANHPKAIHLVEDVREVKMRMLIPLIQEIRRAYPEIKLCLWASLECTNFSKAKGGQPRNEDSRTLAWDMLRYISLGIDKVYIENVEEFMSWGPLDEKGKPVSKNAGQDYLKWVDSIKAMGYNYDYRIINSADLGAVQSRKRYFGQFAKPNEVINWPEKTHMKPAKKLPEGVTLWKPVRDVLNLDDHGASIFARIKDFVPATLDRLIAGIERYVLPKTPAFLIKYYGTGTNAVSLDTAAPTIPTRDTLAYIYAQYLDKAYTSGGRFQGLETAAPAVTTVEHTSLVSAQFMDQQYGKSKPVSIEDPAGTVTNNPKLNLVTCQSFLINPQWFNKGTHSVDHVSPTLIARMDKSPLSLATAQIDCATQVSVVWTIRRKPKPVIQTKAGNLIYVISIWDSESMQKLKVLMACTGIVDIKMRMLEIDELLRIQGFPSDYILKGTKTKKKWFIGNAVEVSTARKIIQANATV